MKIIYYLSLVFNILAIQRWVNALIIHHCTCTLTLALQLLSVKEREEFKLATTEYTELITDMSEFQYGVWINVATVIVSGSLCRQTYWFCVCVWSIFVRVMFLEWTLVPPIRSERQFAKHYLHGAVHDRIYVYMSRPFPCRPYLIQALSYAAIANVSPHILDSLFYFGTRSAPRGEPQYYLMFKLPPLVLVLRQKRPHRAKLSPHEIFSSILYVNINFKRASSPELSANKFVVTCAGDRKNPQDKPLRAEQKTSLIGRR